MNPELHYQLMNDRSAELQREAGERRLAREAKAESENRSGGERRRSIFARILPA
ncbi:hypothetical protein [Streptosporangium pseudovulgare]|uniref:Uncharacterized protein n=1 Tax=Streptosporangium pseudovulgare TaxID=35765 RepID=A0ABQ2R1X3_9ACTN|nr:hypothetical protein [Streptosporangium pseudovulgare]GGQ05574.1 hypothetical protein GCM10010140_39840 [Streptosporangium pseudovulgare]